MAKPFKKIEVTAFGSSIRHVAFGMLAKDYTRDARIGRTGKTLQGYFSEGKNPPENFFSEPLPSKESTTHYKIVAPHQGAMFVQFYKLNGGSLRDFYHRKILGLERVPKPSSKP